MPSCLRMSLHSGSSTEVECFPKFCGSSSASVYSFFVIVFAWSHFQPMHVQINFSQFKEVLWRFLEFSFCLVPLSLVFCTTNSSCLGLPHLCSVFLAQWDYCIFLGFSLSAPWPGKCLYAVNLGNCRVCLLVLLLSGIIVLLVAQYLKIIASNILPSFSVFYHRRTNLVQILHQSKNLKFQD